MPGDPVPSPLAVTASCCAALLATPRRLFRPRSPDRALLASLRTVDPPPAATTVRLRVLPQARQSAPAAVVAEGTRRPLRVHLGMRTFLVEHPRARFLVDPAMCRDVHRRVLADVPAPFRQVVTPGRPVLGMPEALERAGTAPDAIDFALPTHLHWDHVAGLADLPGLAVRTSAVERAHVLDGPTVPVGFVRGPLRDRELDLYHLDGPPVLTFDRSHDVFDDGSVLLVDMAGHTPGSVGVLLATDGGPVLLAGDAAWHGLQIRTIRATAPFPGRLVDHDRDAAFAVLHLLHALPAGIAVVPAHDRDAARPWTVPSGATT